MSGTSIIAQFSMSLTVSPLFNPIVLLYYSNHFKDTLLRSVVPCLYSLMLNFMKFCVNAKTISKTSQMGKAR